MQPLPDTSSRWSKGPSAQDGPAGPTTTPAAQRTPRPGLETPQSLGPSLPSPSPRPAPGRPLPPLRAGRPPDGRAHPRRDAWTPPARGSPFPSASSGGGPRLPRGRGAAGCRRLQPDTSRLQSAGPGLSSSLLPPPPPAALPRVTPGLSLDFRTTWSLPGSPELSPALFMMCCLSAPTDLAYFGICRYHFIFTVSFPRSCRLSH